MPVFVFVRCFHSRIRRAQTRSINCFKVDAEAVYAKKRELFAEIVWIHSGGNHRAEYHVAAGAGKTVKVKSLHLENSGNISPALPVITSSQMSDNGVSSGFTSQTYAPALFAISGMPAAG